MQIFKKTTNHTFFVKNYKLHANFLFFLIWNDQLGVHQIRGFKYSDSNTRIQTCGFKYADSNTLIQICGFKYADLTRTRLFYIEGGKKNERAKVRADEKIALSILEKKRGLTEIKKKTRALLRAVKKNALSFFL